MLINFLDFGLVWTDCVVFINRPVSKFCISNWLYLAVLERKYDLVGRGIGLRVLPEHIQSGPLKSDLTSVGLLNVPETIIPLQPL